MTDFSRNKRKKALVQPGQKLFPMPPLFVTVVNDICTIKTFEKLLNIVFSEVCSSHFSVTTRLFPATTHDLSVMNYYCFTADHSYFALFFLNPARHLYRSNSQIKDGCTGVVLSRAFIIED